MLVFTKITLSSYFVVSPHPSNCAMMKGTGTNISGHIIKSNAHVQGRYMNTHAYNEDTNTHLHKRTYNFIQSGHQTSPSTQNEKSNGLTILHKIFE